MIIWISVYCPISIAVFRLTLLRHLRPLTFYNSCIEMSISSGVIGLLAFLSWMIYTDGLWSTKTKKRITDYISEV